METVFNETHIDQEVHSIIDGNGVITKLTTSALITFVKVSFGDHSKLYHLDGRVSVNDKYPSLSFGHKPDIIFDYGEPKRAKFKFTGTPTWCWVSDYKEELLHKNNIRQVIASTKKPYYTYFAIQDGCTNTESGQVAAWRCAIPLTKKELAMVNP